jgi:hypothetical protein
MLKIELFFKQLTWEILKYRKIRCKKYLFEIDPNMSAMCGLAAAGDYFFD